MYVVALFIEAVSAVQHQGEIAPLGDAYPVMLPGYRGKIDDKEQIFLFVSSLLIKLKILRSPSLALIH